MGERVRVMRHDGRLLAAKAPGPAGADALRAEAALLERARVPGVVELVGTADGATPLLLTGWVGPRSLAEVPRPVDPDHAAALCLAVAGTLARLHRCGIVHGSVQPSHVLLDDHGRPVLCGFGHAGSIGAPVRRPATGHPAAGATPDRHTTADDVAGLGHLLSDLLGPVPPPGLRAGARRRAARWRALRALADHARSDDPQARPSLASLTRSIRRAAPGAGLPSGDGTAPTSTTTAGASPVPARPRNTEGPPRSRSRHSARRDPERRLVPILAAVAVVAVGATTYVGLSSVWATPGGPDDATASASGVARPTVATTTTRVTVAPTTSSPSSVTATTPSTVTPTSSAPSTNPSPSTEGATVVEHDGRRYAVGDPGDVVVVGPWRCDGIDLPVVLRTDDGTVSVFDAWAGPGGRATARTVATLPGARGLTAVADGPGCVVLSVTGPTGLLATLTTEDLT